MPIDKNRSRSLWFYAPPPHPIILPKPFQQYGKKICTERTRCVNEACARAITRTIVGGTRGPAMTVQLKTYIIFIARKVTSWGLIVYLIEEKKKKNEGSVYWYVLAIQNTPGV